MKDTGFLASKKGNSGKQIMVSVPNGVKNIKSKIVPAIPSTSLFLNTSKVSYPRS